MGKLLLASLLKYLKSGIKDPFHQLQQQFAPVPTCNEGECYKVSRGSDCSEICENQKKESQSFIYSLMVTWKRASKATPSGELPLTVICGMASFRRALQYNSWRKVLY